MSSPSWNTSGIREVIVLKLLGGGKKAFLSFRAFGLGEEAVKVYDRS